MAKGMGGWSERNDDPEEIKDACLRAKQVTENGQAALLEFSTSEDQDFSFRGILR